MNESLQKVATSLEEIDAERLIADQRRTLQTKKALRALRKGLTHWKTLPTKKAAATPKRKPCPVAPIPKDRVVEHRTDLLKKAVTKPSSKRQKKSDPVHPSPHVPSPPSPAGGGDASDGDEERRDVIELSSGEEDGEVKAEWKELADMSDRRALAAEKAVPAPDAPFDDDRRDVNGFVHVAHLPEPIGKITLKRQGTRFASAHVYCRLHKACEKWVTLAHLPNKRSLVDWLEAGLDSTTMVEHLKQFYPVTKYMR